MIRHLFNRLMHRLGYLPNYLLYAHTNALRSKIVDQDYRIKQLEAEAARLASYYQKQTERAREDRERRLEIEKEFEMMRMAPK